MRNGVARATAARLDTGGHRQKDRVIDVGAEAALPLPTYPLWGPEAAIAVVALEGGLCALPDTCAIY